MELTQPNLHGLISVMRGSEVQRGNCIPAAEHTKDQIILIGRLVMICRYLRVLYLYSAYMQNHLL